MRRARTGPTVAAALAGVLLLPGVAWAGDVQREDFSRPPTDPWTVLRFDQGPDPTTSGGALTIGAGTLVMLREDSPTPAEWTGSANRLSGWDVDVRMRLGRDATGACLDDATGQTPPTLLWVGDQTDLLQIGFAADGVCVVHPYQEREVVPLDTHRWHRYRVEARGQHVRLLVDGRVVIDRTFTEAGSGTLGLGVETYRGTSTWDDVRYDTAPGRTCTIRGTDGPDVLVGTRRADVICGRGGDDRLSGLGGDDVLIGGAGDDTLLGGDGADLLQGGWGADVLDPGPDGGRAEGGQGDDRFATGAQPAGADQVLGGPGRDVVDYGSRTGPVTVSLDGVGGDGAPGEGDAVGVPAPWDRWGPDVEQVVGGSGDDVLTGSPFADVLTGRGGADRLRGLAGRDVLDGVDGVAGNDDVDGGADADECAADPDDTLVSCNDPDPRPTFPVPSGSPAAGGR